MVEASKTKILLVDDEASIHMVFEEILTPQGFTVDCAFSAEEALERLKDNAYDLAIVDKNLPGLSGLELIRILRGVQMDLKVIMITGFRSYESVVEALRLGAIDYIEKPFSDLDMVVDKVARALTGSDADALRAHIVGLKRAIEGAFVPLGQADAHLEHLIAAGGEATEARAARQALNHLRDILVLSLGEAQAAPKPLE